jgi:hypothetical protein
MPQTASSGRGRRGKRVDLAVVIADLDALAMMYLDAVFPRGRRRGPRAHPPGLGDLYVGRAVPRALLTARHETRTGVDGYNTIFIFLVLPSGTG